MLNPKPFASFFRWHRSSSPARIPGQSPGIERHPGLLQAPAAGQVRFTLYEYDATSLRTHNLASVEEFLALEPAKAGVGRWLNVHGLHPYVVNQLRHSLRIHTLAAEDVLHPVQRPKLEEFPDHLFLVARMLRLEAEEFSNEQVSFFLFSNLLVTFQETAGDVWDPVRERLQRPESRLRSTGVDYLCYALLDALVDHLYPILESYGRKLEELEAGLLARPHTGVQHQVLVLRRHLQEVRRVCWPLREVVDHLHRSESPLLTSQVKLFFRDVYDHVVEAMDLLEHLREAAAGLGEMYMSVLSARTAEATKVLTIMATFFIPLTFLAGVYGMNFEHIPELRWRFSYPVFWAVCGLVSALLAVFFYRKGWLTGSSSIQPPQQTKK